MRHRGAFERLRVAPFGRFVALGLLALVVLVDTLDYEWGLYLNAASQLPGRMDSLLAMVIVFCIYSNAGLVTFFGNRVSRWLGTVSFPVYLLHFTVMCSLTSYLVVQAAAAGRTGATTYAAIASISAVVTLAAAWVFEGVERYCLRRVDRVVRTALQ
jgi:peptidoglycan/LPS O-acetylase OafA/YrhL